DRGGWGAGAGVEDVGAVDGGERVPERIARFGLDGDGLAEGEGGGVVTLPHDSVPVLVAAFVDVEGDVVDDVAPAVGVAEGWEKGQVGGHGWLSSRGGGRGGRPRCRGSCRGGRKRLRSRRGMPSCGAARPRRGGRGRPPPGPG